MMTDKRRTAGDTIVEVLIAVVVIATALGIAYTVATRSLQTARQSQERSEALKIAEGQLELIKGFNEDPNKDVHNNIYPQGTVFCLKPTDPINTVGTRYNTTGLPPTTSAGLATYNANCKIGVYRVGVNVTNRTNYEIVVRWERLGRDIDTIDEVKLNYRLYE